MYIYEDRTILEAHLNTLNCASDVQSATPNQKASKVVRKKKHNNLGIERFVDHFYYQKTLSEHNSGIF